MTRYGRFLLLVAMTMAGLLSSQWPSEASMITKTLTQRPVTGPCLHSQNERGRWQWLLSYPRTSGLPPSDRE
jgi:hypothetical protein